SRSSSRSWRATPRPAARPTSRTRPGRSSPRSRETARPRTAVRGRFVSVVEFASYGPDDLGDALGELAIRVLAAAQVRLDLRLEQRDHVLDEAVQLVGRLARPGVLAGGRRRALT